MVDGLELYGRQVALRALNEHFARMENAQWPSLVDAPTGGAAGGGAPHSVADSMVLVPLDSDGKQGAAAASLPTPPSAASGTAGAAAAAPAAGLGGAMQPAGGAPGEALLSTGTTGSSA